jgi:hypothetical protein
MRFFVEAGVWRDQESEGELMDTVVQGGGDQRGRWQVDGMVSTACRVLVKMTNVQCLQVMELMLRGEVMLQGSRGGQGWTWSKPKLSMCTNSISAHQVFDIMPERNLFSNFEKIFGGV